jgi:exosortase A-associated hydrolase 2
VAESDVKMRPLFLGDYPNRHYVLQFRSVLPALGHIIYIPPFGEEMNRCRALAAGQARAFAAMGFHCTLVDFYGTGDSEGALFEADLNQWYKNLMLTLLMVEKEDSLPVTLWGVRLGALLALDFSSQKNVKIDRLLLWQPVTSGKRFVTQLLRQRVASLVNSGQESETTADIRKRMQAGESVEISGYVLGEALVRDIEGLDLSRLEPACDGRIFWLENSESENDELPAGARKAVAALSEGGAEVVVQRFSAPPIWQLHKRDHAPDLLAKTTALFT